jgi:DNA-binding NtrC family response regulator
VGQLITKLPQLYFIVAASGICEPNQVDDILQAGAKELLLPPFATAHALARLLYHLGSCPQEDVSDVSVNEFGIQGFIGKSVALLSEMAKVHQIARCDATALILGETGTGKELCARAIHNLSSRSAKPFVPVNCGAIPCELVENELFGHEAGAFTSAASASMGLVQEAEGGTLFLDEVDSIPSLAQVKLLRFLQDREFRRVGSRKTCIANVRVVAAANCQFDKLIDQGKFRSDLFYRLSTLTLTLPPLRERMGDISLLVHHFLRKFASEFRRPVVHLSPEVIQRLVAHNWPGNVRELEHTIKRVALLAEGPIVELKAFEFLWNLPASNKKSFQELKRESIRRFEERYVTELLNSFDGNISKAARSCNKNRRAFFQLMRKYHIRPRSFTRNPPHPPHPPNQADG